MTSKKMQFLRVRIFINPNQDLLAISFPFPRRNNPINENSRACNSTLVEEIKRKKGKKEGEIFLGNYRSRDPRNIVSCRIPPPRIVGKHYIPVEYQLETV